MAFVPNVCDDFALSDIVVWEVEVEAYVRPTCGIRLEAGKRIGIPIRFVPLVDAEYHYGIAECVG